MLSRWGSTQQEDFTIDDEGLEISTRRRPPASSGISQKIHHHQPPPIASGDRAVLRFLGDLPNCSASEPQSWRAVPSSKGGQQTLTVLHSCLLPFHGG